MSYKTTKQATNQPESKKTDCIKNINSITNQLNLVQSSSLTKTYNDEDVVPFPTNSTGSL